MTLRLLVAAMIITALTAPTLQAEDVPGVQGCIGLGCKCSQKQLDGGMVDSEQGCRKKCESSTKVSEAMEAYKRDLKNATGLWEDADKESDRALEEFHEAGKEILKEMGGVAGVAKTSEAVLPKIGEHMLKESGRAKVLLQELSQASEGAITVATTLAEMATAIYNTSTAVDNLDYATQSGAKMLARGDEEWQQALDNLERAKTDEAACKVENNALDEKVKTDRAVEKQARRYMEQGGIIGPDGRVITVYYVGNQEFRDAARALDAAKEIVSHRQSGALDRGGVPARVAASHSDEIREAINYISIAEAHIRKGMTSFLDRLRQYQRMGKQLHALRSRLEARP